MDNTIYVANRSTNVSDAEVQQMVAACAKQIAQHIAPAHFVLPAPVLFLPNDAPAPSTQARIITVQDECDDAQALGYHTEDGTSHIWGVTSTKPVMDQGAKALTGPYSVSTILSHEIGEMFMDPFCSIWADTGQGYSIAFEIGDPVQSDYYDIDGVSVSNFVTGPWFNPLGGPGERYDYLGKLTQPFEMSHGGYVVEMRNGETTQRFGREMPEWLREMKLQSETRTQRIQRGQATL